MHDIDRTQMESGLMETFEFQPEAGVFNENQETELAVELLEINSEEELDLFLGDLISKAGKAVGQFVGSPTGQALGGLLKGAAKKVLPMAGQALGGYFGGSTGAQIGGQLGSAASNLFESEAMSGEDRELDAAKSIIRMAGDAVKNIAAAPTGANPRQVATAALTQAAQIHAPGLIAPTAGAGNAGAPPVGGQGKPQTGRWIRRGNKIVIFGI